MLAFLYFSWTLCTQKDPIGLILTAQLVGPSLAKQEALSEVSMKNWAAIGHAEAQVSSHSGLEADQLAVGRIGQQIDPALRPHPHVSDAAHLLREQTLFGDHRVALQR